MEIVETEQQIRTCGGWSQFSPERLRQAKRQGFSDRQLATIFQIAEMEVRAKRIDLGIVAVYKSVDTCAAEFEAYTPYYYSTYETEDEIPERGKRYEALAVRRELDGKELAPSASCLAPKTIMILGGGPNRIGQGIEFDYCCCHASFAMRELGFESVMVNSNPETVSTDYDTSDLLFFEPLTVEDVLNICDRVKPDGVIGIAA